MRSPFPMLLVCSMAIATPAAVLAGAGSSASLTHLRLDLIDLRPDDGIAPAMQTPGMAWTEARSDWGCFLVASLCQRASGPPFGTALSVRSEDRSGAFIATARATSTSLEATSAINTQRAGSVGGISRIAGDADAALPLFVLAPYTAVRITGEYALDASAATGWFDHLLPKARVWTWGADPGSTFAAITAELQGPGPLRHESASGSFTATWSNPQGSMRNIWGGIGVAATGVVAVDEPGTFALLVTGLGCVGMAASRRRGRRR